MRNMRPRPFYSVRIKPMYDRHRRFKRIKIGGRYLHGYWLPAIHMTWGEVFMAKREAARKAIDKSRT